MIKHVNDCRGDAAGGAHGRPVHCLSEQMEIAEPLEVVEPLNISQIRSLDIYIMEKDSKKFYVYNTTT